MNIDLISMFFIFVFFAISIIIGYGLLLCTRLQKTYIVQAMILSTLLHFIGAILYWHMSLSSSADAIGYFYSSSKQHAGITGISFLYSLVHFLRNTIFGDSYLGTYSFFAMIGAIGSTVYLILFNKIVRSLQLSHGMFFLAKKVRLFSYLIACWPSAMFWTSNLGKDSLVYFASAIFMWSIYKISNNKKTYLILMAASICLLLLVRPYLFLVIFIAFLFRMFFIHSKNGSMINNIFLLFILIGIFLLSYNFMNHFLRIDSLDYNNVVGMAIQQQDALNSGTHIPMPTHNPNLLIFFLPYLMLANLFMPLFVFARNMIGIIASFENAFLLYITYKFIKQFQYWKIILKRITILGYFISYFIVGLALLGMINTNLGLASREKLMYLPVFLIIIFLVLAIDKRAIIE